MHKSLNTLFVLLLMTDAYSVSAQQVEVQLIPTLQHTASNLRFSVAGDEYGNNPNVLSELIWDELYSLQYGLKGALKINQKIYGEWSGRSGKAYRGKVSDSDYRFDHRKGVFYQKNLSAHASTFTNFSAFVAYQFHSMHNKLNIKVGPSYHIEKVRLKILNFKNDNTSNDFIKDIDSYYIPTWHATGVRADLTYQLKKAISFQYSIAAHDARLQAKGSWNLRPDLKQPTSYEHSLTRARQLSHRIDMSYHINKLAVLRLGYASDSSSGKKGKDTLYFSNGESIHTQLNEVHAQDRLIFFGIGVNIL